jgi:hypothetical protein
MYHEIRQFYPLSNARYKHIMYVTTGVTHVLSACHAFCRNMVAACMFLYPSHCQIWTWRVAVTTQFTFEEITWTFILNVAWIIGWLPYGYCVFFRSFPFLTIFTLYACSYLNNVLHLSCSAALLIVHWRSMFQFSEKTMRNEITLSSSGNVKPITPVSRIILVCLWSCHSAECRV